MSDVSPDIGFDVPDAELLQSDAAFWEIYGEAFPASEREPPEIILASIRRGVGAAVRARRAGQTVGIATIHLLTDPAAVFLVYLALAPGLRGAGMGGPLLHAAVNYGEAELMGRGTPPLGTIWEVDSPELSPDPAEAALRQRRLEFFRRHGGVLLPQPYVQPAVDGVHVLPMRLMYLAADAGQPMPDDRRVHELVRAMYLQKYEQVNGIAHGALRELLPSLDAWQ